MSTKPSIPKGNNMYLKLDNDSVITLTCSSEESIKDGYVTTKSGVYQNYAEYSSFSIDDTIIDNLKNHDIVKVRGQFKFEAMDGSMQFTSETKVQKTKNEFMQAVKIVRQKYGDAIRGNNLQKELKRNPLYGF